MRTAFYYIKDTDTTHDVLSGVYILPRKDAQTAGDANVDIFTSNDLDMKKEVGNTTDNATTAMKESCLFGRAIAAMVGGVIMYTFGCDTHALNLSTE